MRTKLTFGFLTFLLLGLVGCGDDSFSEYVYLDSLRVISLVASQPEASPGSVVSITPWVSDVQGGGRPLVYSAKGCMDPGIASGATITCDGKEEGLNVSGTFSVASPEFTGVGPVLSVTIPSNALEGKNAYDQFNGVAYVVLFTVTAPDGKSAQSLKRIFVSTLLKQPKNSNPAFNRIESGGEEWSLYPSRATEIQANVTAASAEKYSAVTADLKTETRIEEIYTTWFVTDGTLNRYRSLISGSVKWTPPANRPTSRRVVVVAVTRDGRGGEAVVMKSF